MQRESGPPRAKLRPYHLIALAALAWLCHLTASAPAEGISGLRDFGISARNSVTPNPHIRTSPNPHTSHGRGRVELELVSDRQVPVTAQQEWLRRLAQAGVSNLRIRARRPSDQVGIAVRGTPDAPVYAVTGIITGSSEVLLPGRRFRATEAGRLAQWLDELAELGPPDQRPRKTAFGLSAEQFQEVHKALSVSVGFSTKGLKRREVVEKIAGRVALALRVEVDLAHAMPDDDLVAEDLSSLSCGTALAYVVRPRGLCLVPREGASGRLECVLTPAKPDMKIWPVGWELQKHRREYVPALFEFLNVNVQDVPITQVLSAVAERLKVPVLLDHNAMARHGIEPDKALVNLPLKRITYSLLLQKTLFQAGLKSELRIDEADKPLLWVTTLKPF
jgi:hypothetical protein